MKTNFFNIKKQVFNDDWSEELETRFLVKIHYTFRDDWNNNQQEAVAFNSIEADNIIKSLENQFCDYCVRYTKIETSFVRRNEIIRREVEYE